MNLLVQRKPFVLAVQHSVKPVEPKIFAHDADHDMLETSPRLWNSFNSVVNKGVVPIEEVSVNHMTHKIYDRNVKHGHKTSFINQFPESVQCLRIFNLPRLWFVLLNSILLKEWKLNIIYQSIRQENRNLKPPGTGYTVQHGKLGSICFHTFWNVPLITSLFTILKLIIMKNSKRLSIFIIVWIHASVEASHHRSNNCGPHLKVKYQLHDIEECPAHFLARPMIITYIYEVYKSQESWLSFWCHFLINFLCMI